MKKLIILVAVVSLGFVSCKEECKDCTTKVVVTVDGIVTEETDLSMNLATSPINYCGDQLEMMENNPETIISTDISEGDSALITSVTKQIIECE